MRNPSEGLLLASIAFLFGQHQKTLLTHEALLQTAAQISQPWLHGTLWTTNNVHHSEKRFNIVLVFWEFFCNNWKHMELDHWCQEWRVLWDRGRGKQLENSQNDFPKIAEVRDVHFHQRQPATRHNLQTFTFLGVLVGGKTSLPLFQIKAHYSSYC